MRLPRRDRHPGDRSGSEERAGRTRRFAGHSGLRTRQVRLPVGRQLEHARGRRQPRLRRLGRPVELGALVGDGAEPERALPGRGSGSVRRWRHAGSRPVGEEQPVRDRPVGGAAARREERDGEVTSGMTKGVAPQTGSGRPAGRKASLTHPKNRSSFEKRPGDRGEMARQGRRSLLRRRGAPVGGLAVLCVVLAVPARAATPSPDPPPDAVAPEPPPVTRTQPAQVRSAPATVAPLRSSTVQPGRARSAGAGARGEAEDRREAEAGQESCGSEAPRRAGRGRPA